MLQPTKYELWLDALFQYWDMEYGDIPVPNLEYDNYDRIVEQAFRKNATPQSVCGQLRDVVFGVS